MANLPKKTSNRLGVSGKASASGRNLAVQGKPGASGRNPAASNRMKAVAKKAPEPEPEEELEQVDEVDAPPPIEDESLLGDIGEVATATKKSEHLPLKADEHLLSEKSLYGDLDDDPLEQLNKKKAMGLQKPAKPAAPTPAPASPKTASKLGKPAAPPSSIKGKVKPTKSADDTDAPLEVEEAGDASADSKSAEKTADAETGDPQLETQDIDPESLEPAPSKSSKMSSRKSAASKPDRRDSRISKAVSKKGAAVKDDEVELSNRTSRRTTKRSIRGNAVGFKLTKMHKIGAIAAVVVILVVVAGYSPFMIGMYKRGLTGADAKVDDRKSSAKSLFAFDPNSAYSVFSETLTHADPGVREASIYGMELLGTTRMYRHEAVERLSHEVSVADAPGKVLYINSLATIAQSGLKDAKDLTGDPLAESQKDIETAANAIMPRAEATETSGEVRAAAVDGLRDLRVHDVCKLLIKIASSDDNGSLKEKARLCIPSTALPESASDLLKAVGGADKELSRVAKDAFVQIRDQAKSEILASLIRDPSSSDDVRREVVDALAKRTNDKEAALGLVAAFKDKLPEVRAAAVKGVTVTGFPGPMQALKELTTDGDEMVRVECANTLGKLSDPDSAKLVLESFKNPMSGKTMDAFVGALANRTSGKDLKAIAIVMNVLESNPSSETGLHETLAMLTRANVGNSRLAERRQWSTDQWKKWWANINERENLRKAALLKLEALKKRRDDDHSTFPTLMRETEAQLDILEKCTDMCNPNDTEDIPGLKSEQSTYTLLKMHFEKNASIDMRN